jgi:hypothetical protein
MVFSLSSDLGSPLLLGSTRHRGCKMHLGSTLPMALCSSVAFVTFAFEIPGLIRCSLRLLISNGL